MTSTSRKLAEEYVRLGGRRLANIDDNIISVRSWDKDTPEAEAFWKEKILTLCEIDRHQVEVHLPSISDR